MIKRKGLLVILGMVVLTVVILCIPVKHAVVIEATGSNSKLLAYFPLSKQVSGFQIHYTHSIHRSEVIEQYQVRKDGKIRQTDLIYEETAVGMPANAEEGEKFQIEDGKYHISNMKREFDAIDLSIGQVRAHHRLIVKDKVTPFVSFAGSGTTVRIRERKLALLDLWKGVNVIGGRAKS